MRWAFYLTRRQLRLFSDELAAPVAGAHLWASQRGLKYYLTDSTEKSKASLVCGTRGI